ncbi:hypothetical protein [uncultured Winogradskyella sp.]|uniref:hypothetical protein n=1 Tax=uncultured Winogradskyella sp. TaxID=395353 RepID=UPI00260EA121|nr:hypothetical protein [uncultured Winogradskyella sp.]
MDLNHNTLFQFYQNLGKLFYAIAAIDNSVRDEEFEVLEKLVKKYWLSKSIIEDSSANNLKANIIETFKWLRDDREYDAEACYNSFINFKKQNESIFTDNINSLILKTAGEISASFSGQNKSEVILLAKLNIELKKGK